MRRADRLFQIIQLLRNRRILTAAHLAERLEVSERTIYRDIRDLTLSGVPIDGEAGVGYALPRSFDLPPLMFTKAEIQALVLGTRIVEGWGDTTLSKAAASVLSKVETVLPEHLQQRLRENTLRVPGGQLPRQQRDRLEVLRLAIENQHKIVLHYASLGGTKTKRAVRPLALFYWGGKWTLTAWCELRTDFRTFRVDHIERLENTSETFKPESGQTIEDYLDEAGTRFDAWRETD